MVVPPVGASSVPPTQLAFFVAGVELLMVTPTGRLSVMETLVRSVSEGAVNSILSLELPPTEIVEGENDFVPEKLVPATSKLSLAGCKLLPP